MRKAKEMSDATAAAGVGWLSSGVHRRPMTSVSDPRRRDVFLGGSCGTSRWRDEIAVPILLSVVYSLHQSCLFLHCEPKKHT